MAIDDFPRQLARTRRFTLGLPREVTVSRDGGLVLFLRTQGGEDPVTCLWRLDLADGGGGGRERLLADPAAPWNFAPGDVPEAERVRRERARELASGIVAYSADADCRTVVFALDGRLWALHAGDDPREPAAVPEPVPAAGPATDPRIDPTGQRVAYVTGGALHVTELADGTSRLLAAPEHDDVSYGLAEHVAAESMLRFRGYWWAPDGQRLLAARVDNALVQRWWIADPADPGRPPRAVRYPAAGTANADVTLHVLRLDGSRTEVTWDRGAYEYLATAEWDSQGPLLSVQSRDQRTVLVLAADAGTGQTTLRHTERDDAWVELAPGTPARTSAGDLVTVSDRDGSRRLVVGGAAVTPDGLHVRWVCGTDGEAVYFTATDERDPTQRHLWRYDPGQELLRCSVEPGEHDGTAAAGTQVVLSSTEAGSAAAVAVIRRPDVFHAAVSGAAPHDQRLYDTHWRERFLGLPQENPHGYERSSTMTEAARLTRPLLLVHGLADDNVVVAHTLRMSGALLAAGRAHQVLPLSGATHMPADFGRQLLWHELAFLTESLGVARPDTELRCQAPECLHYRPADRPGFAVR